MSDAFDADVWLSSIHRRAAAALADQPLIHPAPPRPLKAPTFKLAEHRWNPKDGEGILEDLSVRSCVMLRNFLPRGEAHRLAEIGRRSIEAVDSNLALTAQGLPPVASSYCRLRDAEPDMRMGNERSLRAFGGMMVESVPFAGFQLFKLLRESGLLPIVQAYIGGPPLVAGKKCTLRLGEKESPVRHVFHQDGAFLGGSTARTMNIWLALTDAGVDAPGLELLPFRLPTILPVGEDGAFVSWEVKESRVYEQFGPESFVTPDFKPGDALLFDQMCLHRTHVTPDMTQKRLAYECWFFPPDPAYADLRLLAP